MLRYRFRILAAPLGLAAALGFSAGSSAAPHTPPRTTGENVDIAAVKDKLRIFTDGKRHFIALIPYEYTGPYFFYGDGVTFYGQRSFGGGRNGDDSFSRSFWEPRVTNRERSAFQLRDKKYTLDCAGRQTVFTPVADAEAQRMLGEAKFLRPLWKRQSYWLAHDDQDRYFFVDRMREPEGNKSFRLFVGTKGNLKLQKMKNIVSDAKGDVFSTTAGELRLAGSGLEGAWIAGKQKVVLQSVPIEDNHVLVYSDLGVYSGEKLGTPCDDL